MNRCRSCNAAIVWTVTEKGKKMPVDAEPYQGDDPRGLFVLRDLRDADRSIGGGRLAAIAVSPDVFPDEPHYRSHFTTCPDRDDWRNP